VRKSYDTVASSVHRLYNRHWDKLQNPEAVNSLLAEAGGGHFSELTPRIFGLFKDGFTAEALAGDPKLAKLYNFVMQYNSLFNDKSVHTVALMLHSKNVYPLFIGGITGTEGYPLLFKPSRRAFDRCIRKPSSSNFELLDRALSKLADKLTEMQTNGVYSYATTYALDQYEIYLVNSMLREPMNGG